MNFKSFHSWGKANLGLGLIFINFLFLRARIATTQKNPQNRNYFLKTPLTNFFLEMVSSSKKRLQVLRESSMNFHRNQTGYFETWILF